MRFDLFFDGNCDRKLTIIEMGAGTAIPTIRALSERAGRQSGTTIIRINPREPQIAAPHLSLACGALEGLRAIETQLGR
jgi:hypothetical protein